MLVVTQAAFRPDVLPPIHREPRRSPYGCGRGGLVPALPGLPLRASTPSMRGGAGNAAGKAKDERHEDEGDFGDFQEVGLLGPRS